MGYIHARSRNHRHRWTPEELRYLEKNHLRLSLDDIAANIGRTPRAVQAMSYKLGLELKYPRWTEEEAGLLKIHYQPGCDISALCSLFPERTRPAVLAMVDDLGLPRPDPLWCEDELSLLQRYYPTEGSRVSARLPGRSAAAVRIQASNSGITWLGSSRYRPWSKEEKRLLAQSLHLSLTELIQLFPGRSEASVTCARRRVRLRG